MSTYSDGRGAKEQDDIEWRQEETIARLERALAGHVDQDAMALATTLMLTLQPRLSRAAVARLVHTLEAHPDVFEVSIWA